MDPRIADYIARNRGKYTREAIRQQLIDAGHDPADIDATWAILDTPDPDEAAVAGEGFWPRFFLFLIGLNLAVFLLVFLATGMVNSVVLAAVLGVALAIGALIAWAIVAATGPAQMGRTTAMVVGAAIPLLFALLIGGSCYALVGSMGPLPPPPRSGTLTLQIDPPLALQASGSASCQLPPEGQSYYNVYTESPMSSSEGPISVFINAFPEGDGGEPVPTVGITIGNPEQGEDFLDYQPGSGGSAGIDVEPGSTATVGSLTFEGFLPVEAFDEQGQPIDRFDTDPISGTVRWNCEDTAP